MYFAFKYLHWLGDRVLSNAHARCIVTVDDEGVKVLAWHYAPPEQPVSNRSFFTKVQPAAELEPVEIVVSGVSPGSCEARVHRTGFERNDAYTAYLKLAAPARLTPQQVSELQQLTRDEPELHRLEVDASGTVRLELPLREYDVVFVCFALGSGSTG